LEIKKIYSQANWIVSVDTEHMEMVKAACKSDSIKDLITLKFNGGVEEPFSGEDRILVESPKIASYDLKPEMSAYEITKKVSGAIALAHYDFILVNFANGDMVGHTGNFEAGVKAVEALDDCLGVVVKEALSNNYYVVITADHGNVEEMLNIETKTMDKEHSTNPVPIWVVGPDNKRDVPFESLTDLTARGVLADVAPTVLDIMGLKKPEHMTGMSLVGGQVYFLRMLKPVPVRLMLVELSFSGS
jgi:2,3-bisphosphoglycerate-independent phosphoglycerate mutase